MFERKLRLVKEKDFTKVFKQGRAYYVKILGAKVLRNQLNYNRFGVIVSAKVSKKAVIRNRLKRQIRQALKELDRNLIMGHDLVIMTLPAILNCDYQSIKSELTKIFLKLKVLSKNTN